jgi:hypothetical protein
MTKPYLAILGVTPAMSRLTTMADPSTLAPNFHTAAQADQRDYMGAGYDGADAYNARTGGFDSKRAYPADPSKRQRRGNTGGGAPADANVCRITRDPVTGVADVVRLEATGDGWIDLGGKTPRDMKVVNW